MDSNAVAITALGIVVTAVAALVWIVKFLMLQMRASLDRNAKAHLKVAEATNKNTKVSEETLKFLRALNGKVAKAAIQTVKEQHIDHQTVETQEIK